ncbi:MAG TPA: TonB family protein [Pyrinomonadaceae bacterium]|nr:TonB family protein [Pyrinomonadaceae bacterium]
MGKIVKYCSSCDEGFAEKFGFCPDCGTQLQAFEMSPVEGEIDTVAVEPEAVDAEIDATPIEVEPVVPAPVFLQAEEAEEFEEIDEPAFEDTYEPVEGAAPVPVAAPTFYQTSPTYADEPRNFATQAYTPDEDAFHVTVIEEKNGKQRNGLLVGAAVLVLFLTVGSWGVSLFQKDMGIGAIGDETSLAYLGVDVPMPIDETPEKKAKDKDDGGGGGGGREDKEETSQGDLADQTKNPIIHPDVRIYKSDNFELKQPVAATEGDKKFEKIYDRYGDPNSKFAGLSNGPGMGGGQGTGYGQGQGSGYGTGAGSGSGSGYGSGNGDGNGSGSGRGGGDGPPPSIAAPKVTTAAKITYQPKATYTDTARSNNVQGAVRLKITLLASGQVGAIVPVTRLPDGLTEKAIAAAKQIRFEPKMVNGVPVSVIVTREYTFTIY